MTRSSFIAGLIISGCIAAAGVCLFVVPLDSVRILGRILGVMGVALGIVRLLFYLFGRGGSFEITIVTLIGGAIALACGLFLLLWPNIIFEVVKVTLAAWFFLIGGVQFIVMYTYAVTRQKDWVFALIESACNLLFGILIVTLPDAWEWLLSTIIALNFVMYGVSEFVRLLFFKWNAKKKITSRSLPVLVESAAAGQALDAIKSVIRREEDASLLTSDKIVPEDDTAVEVLVHLSELAGQGWGHVDLVAGGMVFSYGNYDRDKANRRFFGLLWDGVLSLCEREEYVQFSVDVARKTVICYRLDLDAAGKKALGDNIRMFLQDCVPWEPNKKSTYAGALARRGAKLFKMKSGLFHTYFGLNANCALLVSRLLDGTGAPRPRANGGPVTPGSVLIAYENEMKRLGGCVSERSVYINKRIISEEKRKAEKVRRELVDLKNYIDRERNIKDMKK